MNEITNDKISAWAEAVIEILKQKILDGEAYLIWASGLPWYRRGGDAWVDENWWIETAKIRYDRAQSSPNSWIINELEILCTHFLEQYCTHARQEIDNWYENYHGHDPEDWLGLTCQVYPEHPMLREYLDDWSWIFALAGLGDAEAINRIRDLLIGDFQDEQLFGGNNTLLQLDRELIDQVITTEELQRIHIWNLNAAQQEDAFWHGCMEIASHCGWDDVIDRLSDNENFLKELNEFDILRWSLTKKHQITQQLILQQNSATFENPNFGSDPTSQKVALAIAWKRSCQPQ